MYTVNIHHKGDIDSTSYKIYKKEEADNAKNKNKCKFLFIT